MAIKTSDQIYEPIGGGGGGRLFNLPVDGGTTLYRGTMISQLDATSMAVPATTALSGVVKGVATHGIDNSGGADAAERVEVHSDRAFAFTNGSGADAVSEATPMFAPLYASDDTTVCDNSAGGTRSFAGYFFGLEPDGKIRTFIPSADVSGMLETGWTNMFSGHGVVNATTANITLSGEQTIDGVLTAASRILVKNQSAPAENGLYVTAAGAWTRCVDADGSDEVIPGMLVYVSQGTENLRSWFFCTNTGTITVGTTGLTFVEVPALHDLASVTAGEGASLIGVQDSGARFVGTEVETALSECSTLVEMASVATGDGAALVGVEDAAANFAATDVEAALAEIISLLASVANTEGASMVGVEDAAANFAATDVEAALAEIISLLASVANTEGASMVGVEDAAANFAATDVEAALAEIMSLLASVATGEGASLVGIEDAAANFAATDVEAALAEIITLLASVANTEGASMVGIEDAAANFAATDVEAALAEIMSLLASNANTEGASLVGIEDSAAIYTATDVEAALAEIGGLRLQLLRTATITSAELTTAGVGPETENLGAVLSQNAVVLAYRCILTDAFDNGAGVSLVMEVGNDGDADAYEDGFDCFTGSIYEGTGRRGAVPGPGLGGPAFLVGGTGQMTATFTAGADQLANFTNGSVTIELYGIIIA